MSNRTTNMITFAYQGNTTSASCKPFHVACSKNQYPPAPSFTNIIRAIVIPLNVSKELSRNFFGASDDEGVIGSMFPILFPCLMLLFPLPSCPPSTVPAFALGPFCQNTIICTTEIRQNKDFI